MTMAEKKILIAGLPNAGKSSYIGALNGIMSQDGEFCLSPALEKASEWPYVTSLTEKWLECQEVDHSSDGETKYIKWPLKKNDGQEVVITIPDMKGETYYDIINNEFDSKLAEFCKGATGILFFINNMNRFVLKEHALKLVEEENGADKEVKEDDKVQSGSKTETDKLKLNVSTIPDVTKNLLVIRYLRELMGNVKIVVAVSSWDEKKNYKTIEEYFQKICPAIYNYVRNNFDFYRFYGVSAQGVKYGNQNADIKKLTETGKRAYVYTDKQMFDLSQPLDYLISE